MKAQQLKNAILQLAISGKLVPQDPNDEPASELLCKIQAEKDRLIAEGKIKKSKKSADKAPYTNDEPSFEIPESWVWVRLGDIVEVKGGKRIPAGLKLTRENTGYKYIRVADMKDGSIIDSDIHYITKSIYEKIQSYTISSDDLYITCAGTIGKVGLVPSFFNGANLTENANKLVFTNLKKEWLFYFLCSSFIQDQIKEHTTKVGQPKLAIKRISDLYIPLVPLSEQHRIVAKIEELLPFIDQYDQKEQVLTALNKNFPDQLKKSILQAAIQGKLTEQLPIDEPASQLIQRVQAEKERLILDKKLKKPKVRSEIIIRDNLPYEIVDGMERCIQDEVPFDIPESWVWVRLEDIVYSLGQKRPNNKFCYIDVGSINNNLHKLSNIDTIIEPENAPSRARKMVEYGSILYSTVRPYLQNICIIDRNFNNEPIVSTAFAVMNTFNGIYNKYLFYYLLSPAFTDFVNQTMVGVAYPAINDENLYRIIVPIPPIEEQKRIVEKVELLLTNLQKLS